MPEKIAKVCQPVLGAFAVECPGGKLIKATSEVAADEIADAINGAYLMGLAQARREVRAALGLRDWGGEVTVPAESR